MVIHNLESKCGGPRSNSSSRETVYRNFDYRTAEYILIWPINEPALRDLVYQHTTLGNRVLLMDYGTLMHYRSVILYKAKEILKNKKPKQ